VTVRESLASYRYVTAGNVGLPLAILDAGPGFGGIRAARGVRSGLVRRGGDVSTA